ncbi:MAG TPA: RDD family protein [Dokdonella sp.]|uniref:RDD family protein n=1 Tax=Dokdonella sp. TaxID=2291710 RepID=UPI0025BE47E1|nr:RDD family protein [Dokdonella sp.]MBX3691389.1 RDD family protein [Dokdonella sp.]MCW5566743.1 RDD family protein [Dokdonella sp.]HNR91152.1 RDD family protein [Dokdonella sp.]
MDTIKHALVLTGEVQPGFVADQVWPALAAYFRMEPERLRNELLARAPISIKESDDLAKLQGLQSGAAAAGAVTELHAIGPDGSVFVLVGNTPRGPVPTSYVEQRVRSGAWPSDISIASVGSSAWRPFIAPSAAPARVPPPDQQATVAFSAVNPGAAAPAADLRTVAAAPGTPMRPVEPLAGSAGLLPEGLIVHAGFWRRFAAYSLDSLILGVPFALIFGLLVYQGFKAAFSGENPGGMFVLLYFLFYVAAIVGSWLYFAKFESGAHQATPGKRMMGIKVTSTSGQRISFGRATGRFFAKIVTNLIPFGIGWMLAGWTGRKQAIHDMMATTCVVFREVEPGRPMPTTRPPMPWYGWVLNILPFVFALLGAVAYGWFMATLLGGMSSMSRDLGNMDIPDMGGTDYSTTMSSSSSDADRAAVQIGLSAILPEVTALQLEAAEALASTGECASDTRASSNTWIGMIELGGAAPDCTITVRLSASSDIPFAARIERIEWTWTGSDWACSSSMDSSYLPWPCD